MVLYLFLSHLGLGIVFALVFVSREAGVKFFRFNAGLAAILIVVALAFRPGAVDRSAAGVALASLLVAEAAIVVYWTTVGRVLASIRPALVSLAVAGGLFTLLAQALAYTGGQRPPMRALTVASFFASAALLGTASTAMVLGHWYLILPSMQVRHLQSIVKLHMASMGVRIVVVAAAAAGAMVWWPPGVGPSFRHYVTSLDGIFFWQRVLFGLAGPLLLSYLTWETAKIRSTQSATGILYVDFLRRDRRRGAREVSAARDACARVVHSTVRLWPDGLRIAPRSGTCAISACEPRQGRKAAALSRS